MLTQPGFLLQLEDAEIEAWGTSYKHAKGTLKIACMPTYTTIEVDCEIPIHRSQRIPYNLTEEECAVVYIKDGANQIILYDVVPYDVSTEEDLSGYCSYTISILAKGATISLEEPNLTYDWRTE